MRCPGYDNGELPVYKTAGNFSTGYIEVSFTPLGDVESLQR
jgi:hypothetical protein